MLQALAVSKIYAGGVRALDGVELEVGRGERVALIGESGSGKTTLLRMFNRTVEPTTGEIRIGGEPARAQDPVALRRRIGFVPQEGGLMPHWRVQRNVELVPALLEWDRARCRERAWEMLRLVGLEPGSFAERYPAQLSGGQRQRVAIARALAADPECILLDEPFGALDAITRHELQNEFLELERLLAKTLLLVTHDLMEAFRLADRVAVMRRGRILQLDSPDELRRAPTDDYVASLIQRAASDG
jgi:osmoprotectant transport system ATP-binding protein